MGLWTGHTHAIIHSLNPNATHREKLHSKEKIVRHRNQPPVGKLDVDGGLGGADVHPAAQPQRAKKDSDADATQAIGWRVIPHEQKRDPQQHDPGVFDTSGDPVLLLQKRQY